MTAITEPQTSTAGTNPGVGNDLMGTICNVHQHP